MATGQRIYGEVRNKTDLKEIFAEIRQDVDQARSRPALTELYKRAGYLIALSQAPSWQKRFGDEAPSLRKVGKEEFAKTARSVNHRAGEIGTEADYDETWGR